MDKKEGKFVSSMTASSVAWPRISPVDYQTYEGWISFQRSHSLNLDGGVRDQDQKHHHINSH
ncbi:hypothetical protein JHK85_002824 [Glycine max]|uniref:Uncharacterized protein n=1 Tax=Glycine soja TaxID=3848 RepID=A0A0B2RDH4_GLYSO|nr:hypothetical protein JHK87_002754 [Glycine soja]KAG5070447.1 hypothetical protein JHK85_002824 [Glycine max]KHN30424.1 hypothetical protein glysoja_033162 [Glycine soja]